jgi:hypothetical protein
LEQSTIQALKDATGRFKDNPEAIAAALDQVGISIDQLIQQGTAEIRRQQRRKEVARQRCRITVRRAVKRRAERVPRPPEAPQFLADNRARRKSQVAPKQFVKYNGQADPRRSIRGLTPRKADAKKKLRSAESSVRAGRSQASKAQFESHVPNRRLARSNSRSCDWISWSR